MKETLLRGEEPYYRQLPYRNRTDNSPSWQYEQCWNAPHWKGRIACGANRIGKSMWGAYETVLMITGEHPTYATPKKGIAWIVGADSKMIESVQRPYFEMLLPSRYKRNGSYHGKNYMWRLKSDGREWEVWFKSIDSGRQKFQGAKIDFAWIDEEPSKTDVFTEIELRLVDNQGTWLMTATPVEGTRWLKETIDRNDVYHTMAGMRENPYLPIEEVEKIALSLPKDERDVRIEGKYLIFGGRPVFDRDQLRAMSEELTPFVKGIIRAA